MTHGYSDVLVGLQYGDEGKAKVVDLLADQYEVIARFNGGANAGHTVVTPRGRISLKQMPSGIFRPGCDLYIGSGCAVNLTALAAEVEAVHALDIPLAGRFHVSAHAAVIQPHHIIVDTHLGREIGTTKNGIGPCYADRALRANGERRLSFRLADFVADLEGTLAQIRMNVVRTLAEHPEIAPGHDPDEAVDRLREAFGKLRGFVQMDDLYLWRRVDAGARVLFEGAQSIMLDVAKGTAPYVTASHTTPGYAYVGGDLPPRYHRRTIGIAKAVVSRVGNGPFVSELGGERSARYCAMASLDGRGRDHERSRHTIDGLLRSGDPFDLGMALRMMSDEYGTGTGRPRRIGMLDLVQLGQSIKLNGIDVLFLNKCDLLEAFGRSAMGRIPVVAAYADGQTGPVPDVRYFDPFPELSETPADRAALPRELEDILSFIEETVGCPFLGIGVGPERDQCLIWRDRLAQP